MTYHNSRLKEEKKAVKWITLLFIIGGIIGVYLLNTIDEEIQYSYIYYFFSFGYLTTIPYLFIRLVKKSGWLLFELPVFDAILIYLFIPFIFAFFGIWYFLKLIFLLMASIIGIIPYYLWNVGKLVFGR